MLIFHPFFEPSIDTSTIMFLFIYHVQCKVMEPFVGSFANKRLHIYLKYYLYIHILQVMLNSI